MAMPHDKTRTAVCLVADQLFFEEAYAFDAITTSLVRDRLGSGSFTTIGDELKSWKKRVTQKLRNADLPEPIQSAAIQLWTLCRETAAEDWASERATSAAGMRAAEELATQRAQEIMTLEQSIAGTKCEVADLHQRISDLTDQLNASLQRAEVAEALAQERQQHIDEAGATLQRLRGDAELREQTWKVAIEKEVERGNAEQARLMKLLDAERTEKNSLAAQIDAQRRQAEQRHAEMMTVEQQLRVDGAEQTALLSQAREHARTVTALAEERQRQADGDLRNADRRVVTLESALQQSENQREEIAIALAALNTDIQQMRERAIMAESRLTVLAETTQQNSAKKPSKKRSSADSHESS